MELSELHMQISLATARLREVTEKVVRSRDELGKITSQACKLNSEIITKEMLCSHDLINEIAKLIDEKAFWQAAEVDALHELEITKRIFEKNKILIANDVIVNEEIEKLAILSKKITSCEMRTKMLHEKKRELEAAVDEMNPLLLKRDDLIKNINCTKQRIKTEEEEINGLNTVVSNKQQELKILQKRNQARLTRMRRQLKEEQAKYSELHEEVVMLQSYLQTLQ